ncbi:hypothetical protein [Amycolatopsis aidingensis]|uniref:hypothetical protein n=1 Tax=Amycolatopsis aidingensis TaxID=2842453 RepID=UPI001E35891A|nr:hypothetical protein [Amycolatopsis aidingensis]
MLDLVLALPRRLLGAVRTAGAAVVALPRISSTLDELRETAKQLEKLATFAVQELPEVIYQLEAIRAELTAIERRLQENDRTVTPGSPRTG